LEVLDYHESYGGEVHLPAWRRQFVDKHHGSPLQLNGDIKNISGATLSCGHITDGVRRLLATYALVLAAPEH
jgi:Na+-transporting NADH:ubiquinone oxidoreductase subunit NqrC